jgi:hypothetical protein
VVFRYLITIIFWFCPLKKNQNSKKKIKNTIKRKLPLVFVPDEKRFYYEDISIYISNRTLYIGGLSLRKKKLQGSKFSQGIKGPIPNIFV